MFLLIHNFQKNKWIKLTAVLPAPFFKYASAAFFFGFRQHTSFKLKDCSSASRAFFLHENEFIFNSNFLFFLMKQTLESSRSMICVRKNYMK